MACSTTDEMAIECTKCGACCVAPDIAAAKDLVRGGALKALVPEDMRAPVA